MQFMRVVRTPAVRGRALWVGVAVCAALAGVPAAAAASGTSAWGYNAYGELGDESTTRSTTPVAVSGLGSGVRSVSAGVTHALALRNDGTVLAWGANEYGQLGTGSASGPETCSFSEPCSTKPLARSRAPGAPEITTTGERSA